MSKTHFYTRDIFDNKDVTERMRYFNSCHKAALRCGLTVRCIMKDKYPKLELWGTKSQFVKYYTKTLLKCEHKCDGIKRFMATITW